MTHPARPVASPPDHTRAPQPWRAARRWLALLVLGLGLPLAVLAQTLPAPLSDTVSDFADALPPEVEARIAGALRAGRAETGVHVVLAVIDRRADHGDTGRLDAFATRSFNAWGIGDPERNDGILILVATGDRELRIALGAGYPAVYDGRAHRVIDSLMLPAFREDRYAEGIEAGVAGVFEHIARPFKEGRQVTETEGFGGGTDWSLAAFLTLAAGMIAFHLRRGIGDALTRLRACPQCRARRLARRRSVETEPGETTRGQMAEHTTCAACGHDDVRFRAIPSLSEARKSSSSGGFGGGRSSGGGASGRW
ncbi:MAG: TPM domain-containing protein [Gemmobacter sp.]